MISAAYSRAAATPERIPRMLPYDDFPPPLPFGLPYSDDVLVTFFAYAIPVGVICATGIGFALAGLVAQIRDSRARAALAAELEIPDDEQPAELTAHGRRVARRAARRGDRRRARQGRRRVTAAPDGSEYVPSAAAIAAYPDAHFDRTYSNNISIPQQRAAFDRGMKAGRDAALTEAAATTLEGLAAEVRAVLSKPAAANTTAQMYLRGWHAEQLERRAAAIRHLQEGDK